MIDWFNSKEIFEILIIEKDENTIKDEISKIIKLLGLTENSKICDFASRNCQYSIELAKMGYKVTAIDSIRMPLEKIKKLCNKRKIPIDISIENLKNFARSEYFDAIINYAIPFCFFTDEDDDFRVLKNLVRSLKTGGKLLLRLIPKEIYIKNFCGKDWFLKEKKIILKETKMIDDWSKLEIRWFFIDSKKREFNAYFKLYSGFEIKSLLRQSGIEETRLFGDLEGNPFDENAKELFALAIKK